MKKEFSRFERLLIRIKYPKLLLFAFSILVGILIYTDENNFHFHLLIEKFGFFATFLAGVFFSHGLTVGPAIATLLLIGNDQPLVTTGLIAIAGSIVGNFLIFEYLRVSYAEEIDHASETKLFLWIVRQLNRFTPNFVRKYMLPVFAGIASALPFPDEFAMALVHASKDFSFRTFSIVSFVFNVFGIFIILWLGKFV
jgi:hypothetical protein